VIRPERVRIEEFGSAGPNRVPAMVQRLVYLGSATQAILRLAAGPELQVLLQNDGTAPKLAQGTPVHAFLAPEALRVLAGGGLAPGAGQAPAELAARGQAPAIVVRASLASPRSPRVISR
jgi:hypothetical protein